GKNELDSISQSLSLRVSPRCPCTGTRGRQGESVRISDGRNEQSTNRTIQARRGDSTVHHETELLQPRETAQVLQHRRGHSKSRAKVTVIN
ncbi:hypothetical protein PMAYCL1PPCAC_02833, partial [Pristionchus mayeri]